MEAINRENRYYTIEDYYNAPEGARIELINGELYDMVTPSRIHQKVLSELHIAIGNYIKSKSGTCEVYPAPFSVQLNKAENTIVEPDISVICDPGKLTDKGCLGAPDWIIEIVSPSDPGHDYLTKLNLYLGAGVREYWIIDPLGKSIAVYSPSHPMPKAYSFNDTVKAGIYEDFSIDFSEIARLL